MALILKNGAIFLHVPKTGGSWVTAVLKDQGLVKRSIGHIHADLHRVLWLLQPQQAIQQVLLEQIKSFVPLNIKRKLSPYKKTNQAIWAGKLPDKDTTPFIFCFVRHPISWYESIWRYMYQSNFPHFGQQYSVTRWHPLAMLNSYIDSDFNKFIDNILANRPGFASEVFGWYTLPGINFIGKQENLIDDLIQILQMMNLDFDEHRIRTFGEVNKSRYSAELIWDSTLRQKTLLFERAMLERYGYSI